MTRSTVLTVLLVLSSALFAVGVVAERDSGDLTATKRTNGFWASISNRCR